MTWTKSQTDGVTRWQAEEGAPVWRHEDGIGTIAASGQGVFVLIPPRLGRFVKGERWLLDILSQCGDEETEHVLIMAWGAHLLAVIERDAPHIPQLTDEAPLRMPRKGDFS